MSKDVKKRWASNGIRYKSSTYFWHAIQKYSWDGFDHIVLYNNLFKKEAEQLEIELIDKYQTRNPKYGYNLAKGGIGGAAYTGEKHPFSKKVYQYNLDGTFIREWENAQRASEELNICVSDIHATCRENNNVRQAGHFIWSYKYKESLEPYTTKIGWRKYPIFQLDNNFNIVQRYNCISDVDDTTYIRENVTNCCVRKSLTHNGYYWCYEKDFNNEFVQYAQNRIKNMYKRNFEKEVNQYDEHWNLVSTYLSVKDASDKTSLNPNTIRAYCNRGMNNYGFNSTGFYWRYAKDMPQTDETLGKVV